MSDRINLDWMEVREGGATATAPRGDASALTAHAARQPLLLETRCAHYDLPQGWARPARGRAPFSGAPEPEICVAATVVADTDAPATERQARHV